MTRDLIVCPAAPDRTRATATSWWGACPTGMTAQFLDRRQRTMHQYRSAGDPVTAERYGWLTLAGLWVRLGPQASLSLEPTHRISFTGTLITPADQAMPNSTAPIRGTDLTAIDPRDAFGLWLADLAADAATRAVVTIGDVALSGAIVTDALAQILSTP